jgi:SAM-dependent methyltransferase
VSEYVLDHHREGERQRLALMSRLLDPMHRRHIERLGAGPGARTLEVGCGNGSISAWLAERTAPGGRAVAVDLDLSLVSGGPPGLEFRQADIVAGPVERGDFDLVTARAVLHHVADAAAALGRGTSVRGTPQTCARTRARTQRGYERVFVRPPWAAVDQLGTPGCWEAGLSRRRIRNPGSLRSFS